MLLNNGWVEKVSQRKLGVNRTGRGSESIVDSASHNIPRIGLNTC